jgi:hypothetical protein
MDSTAYGSKNGDERRVYRRGGYVHSIGALGRRRDYWSIQRITIGMAWPSGL